jgi:hypothetical protein
VAQQLADLVAPHFEIARRVASTPLSSRVEAVYVLIETAGRFAGGSASVA